MPETVKRAVINGVPEYSRYPDPFCRALRAELAARRGLEVSTILNGNGASELIFAICSYVKPRKALVTAPTFSEYERAVRLFGGEITEHRLLEYEGFNVTERILTEIDGADIIILCNPNNPTGRLIDAELLIKIAEVCKKNETLFLLDECFIDFTRGESMLRRLKEYPNLLALQAFTKIYAMAGLRLGTLYCADERLLSKIAERAPTWSVSGVAQIAGIAALRETDWIEISKRVVESERAFMEKELSGLGIKVYESDANFLLLKSNKPIYERLKARGILTRSCANFSGLDERYIRIGLKTRNENMTAALAIAEALNG